MVHRPTHGKVKGAGEELPSQGDREETRAIVDALVASHGNIRMENSLVSVDIQFGSRHSSGL